MNRIIKSLLIYSFFVVFFTSCCTPLNVQTLSLNAKRMLESGDVDGAISRLESINDLDPNSYQNNYNLGVAYYQKKDVEKALKSLDRAIELNPKLADAYYTKAVILEDKAYSYTEEDGNSKISEAEKNNLIVENLNNSKENFNKFVEISQNEEEVSNTKVKIDQLNKDIEQYKKKLSDKD